MNRDKLKERIKEVIEGEACMYMAWNQERGKITCIIQGEEHVLTGMNKETRLLFMNYLEDSLIRGTKRDDK